MSVFNLSDEKLAEISGKILSAMDGCSLIECNAIFAVCFAHMFYDEKMTSGNKEMSEAFLIDALGKFISNVSATKELIDSRKSDKMH